MNILHGAALAGCLIAAGCAGPLDRRWDNPVYRSIHDRLAETDERLAHGVSEPTPRAVSEPDLASLERLSIDDAIRIAIGHHPTLRRAGYRLDAAAGREAQAALYPNPSLAFDGEALGADAGEGGETSYRIEQEIMLGGKLRHARGVAEADRLTAQTEFVGEEFATASRVTRAYFTAVTARERLESREELIALSRRVLDAANAQVQTGAATEPDRLRAEVVREQAEIALESARLAYESARRALASTMGLEQIPELPLSTPADELPVLPGYAELARATLERSTRVSTARIAIERARRAHELARAEGVPDLVASLGPRYSDPDSETTFDVGVGIELPLFDRNQGNIRAALADRLSSAANLREVRLQLLAEVSEAWASYQSARAAAERYHDQLLPKAEQTLALTREAYERGKSDYLRLLDAQQVVVESRIAHVDALERVHVAASVLRELAQTDAPWRGALAGSTPESETTP